MSVAPNEAVPPDAALEAYRRERAVHVERIRRRVESTSARRLASLGRAIGSGPAEFGKLRHNAYAMGLGDLGVEDLLIATACAVQAATHRPLVFSNDTSCAVWGLPTIGSRCELVEYIMPPGARGRTAEVRRRRTSLTTEAVEVGGLPVTPYERTLVDHARHAMLESGVAVCDDALHRSLTTRDVLLVELDKVPKGRRGRRMAQLVIHLADSRAESPLESLSRTRMFQSGLPMPELQWRFYDGDEFIGRTDFYWPALGLVGESDGDVKYEISQEDSGQAAVDVLLREKKRELRLRRHPCVDDLAHWDWGDALPYGKLHAILGAHGLRSVLDGGWPIPDGPLPKRAFHR